jgi:DNA-binding NarL/FixJ family response regulator
MGSDPVRVVIADDDERFRRAIKTMLSSESDIEVVAEASDGEEVIALVTEHAPHVVLMDIRMPALTGIDATRVLSEIHPSANVVILTVSDEQSDLFAALRAGASSYLLKDVALDGIAQAVRDAREGDPTISGPMAAKLFSEFASMHERSGDSSLGPQITHRELQVLQHLSNGRSPQQIGEELSIAASTVRNLMRNLIEKLHIYARIEDAIAARLDAGVVEP